MQSDITIPSLALLTEVAGDLIRAASLSGARSERTAYCNALDDLPRVYAALRFDGGDLVVPSASTAGRTYRVRASGCACKRGGYGGNCRHAALAEIVLVARDRQGDDDDCDVEDGDPYETYAPPPDVDSEPFLCSHALPDDDDPADLAPARTRLARVIAAARAAVWQVAA